MPQRSPRSPEPIGAHSFGGALGTDRLNPTPTYTHPDPFTIGALNATTLTATTLSGTSGNSITLTDSIVFDLANISFGTSAIPLVSLYLQSLRGPSGSPVTLYSDLAPGGSVTVGQAGDRFANAYLTDLNVSGTATIGTLGGTLTSATITTLNVGTLDDTGSGIVTVTASLAPSGTLALGSAASPWNTAEITTLNVDTLTAVGTTISVNHDLIPVTANLGGSATPDRWTTAYITTLDVTTIDDHGGGSVAFDTSVTVAASKSFGQNVNRWANGYFDDMTISDLVIDQYIDFTLDTTSAGAGLATLPSAPVGFITVKVDGTTRKIPFYGI